MSSTLITIFAPVCFGFLLAWGFCMGRDSYAWTKSGMKDAWAQHVLDI